MQVVGDCDPLIKIPQLIFRENCLKFLRMTSACQKSKCKQLQNSWYTLGFCLFLYFYFISYISSVHCLFFSGQSTALLTFQSYHPSGYEATEHSHWTWICRQGLLLPWEKPFHLKFDSFHWLNSSTSTTLVVRSAYWESQAPTFFGSSFQDFINPWSNIVS